MENPFDEVLRKLTNIETIVSRLEAQQPEQVSESDRMLSLPELEAYLPEKLARQTIYNLVSSGKIPFHKRPGGGKLLFRKSEIDLWISGKPVTCQ